MRTTSANSIVGRIHSIQVGTVAPLGPEQVPSGFVKRSVAGPVAVERLGVTGDQQADLTVHGGEDKAVYGYGLSAYETWRQSFPQHAERLVPGGLGENLTIAGMQEQDVAIGDVVRIGGVVLQVTQPRQPCFKFALRFEDPRMPSAMVRNGLCGWYYRVLETGTLDAEDTVTLEARPNPEWSIARFYAMITRRTATVEDIEALAHLEGLARHWRVSAQAQLRQIEGSDRARHAADKA